MRSAAVLMILLGGCSQFDAQPIGEATDAAGEIDFLMPKLETAEGRLAKLAAKLEAQQPASAVAATTKDRP
jgi:hypothetical protein